MSGIELRSKKIPEIILKRVADLPSPSVRSPFLTDKLEILPQLTSNDFSDFIPNILWISF